MIFPRVMENGNTPLSMDADVIFVFIDEFVLVVFDICTAVQRTVWNTQVSIDASVNCRSKACKPPAVFHLVPTFYELFYLSQELKKVIS